MAFMVSIKTMLGVFAANSHSKSPFQEVYFFFSFLQRLDPFIYAFLIQHFIFYSGKTAERH